MSYYLDIQNIISTFAGKRNMRLPFHIVEMLGRKLGNRLRQAADCDRLALDIYSITGERLGSTTLKRLLGFVDDERKTYISTLDIIANYLGYNSWHELEKVEDTGNSDFAYISEEIVSSRLEIGDTITLSYLPDRHLDIKYVGNSQYLVTKSIHGKLKEGDIITVGSILPNYPLHVSKVIRNGENLGEFVAGKIGGVTNIVYNNG